MRPRRGVALLLVLGLTAACGSRLPDETLEALDARSTGNVTAGPQASNGDGQVAAGDTTDTPVGGGDGGTSSDGASNGGSSGSTGNAVTATTAPGSTGASCASAGATAPGVSRNEIRVSSIVTDSGPLPGATEGSYRGAASYFAKINSEGGICGRKITLMKGDDGLDPAKARAEFRRLEPKSLAIVSAFSVADSGFVDLISPTGIPYVSLTVDPSGSDVANVYPKNRRDLVNTAPFVWWKRQHPNVTKAALLYADIGGVDSNVPGFEKAMQRAGFQIVHKEGVPVTEVDFTGIVRNLQSKGVQFVYAFAFEVNMQVRFVRNMKQQGYNPEIKGANIAFNTRFSELLGKDGDGWENHQSFLPFLDPAEKGRSKALADFIDWNERQYPGAALDLFPVDGWGYAAYFVDALRLVGGNLTRKSLLAALPKVAKFDFGGINAPTEPGTGNTNPCFVMAKHVNGSWKREHPAAGGYECSLGELYKFK